MFFLLAFDALSVCCLNVVFVVGLTCLNDVILLEERYKSLIERTISFLCAAWRFKTVFCSLYGNLVRRGS